MFNIKTAIICGALAFVLSVFAGLTGGVGAGLLFLRAVVFFLLFSGISVGMEIVLRKFLPELFMTAVTEDKAGDSFVDIVLDDSGDQEEFTATGKPDVTVFSTQKNDRQDSADDSDTLDDFVEEVGEVEEISEFDESSDDIEEIVAADMEELPGLDSFADSFENAGGINDGFSPGSGARDMAVDVLGDHQNVETVTRAIRTAMKKDQEG